MQTYPRHESPKAQSVPVEEHSILAVFLVAEVKLSFDLAPVEVVISLRRHW